MSPKANLRPVPRVSEPRLLPDLFGLILFGMVPVKGRVPLPLKVKEGASVYFPRVRTSGQRERTHGSPSGPVLGQSRRKGRPRPRRFRSVAGIFAPLYTGSWTGKMNLEGKISGGAVKMEVWFNVLGFLNMRQFSLI